MKIKKIKPKKSTVAEQVTALGVHLVQIPSEYLRGQSVTRCKAEGVLFAEKLVLFTPDEYLGKVALQFVQWDTPRKMWEIPEIQHFCEGLLWGVNLNDGILTAFHAQQVLSYLFLEAAGDLPIWGQLQLITTVFSLPRAVQTGSFSVEAAQKARKDILADSAEKAEDRWITLHGIVAYLIKEADKTPPYLLLDAQDRPVLQTMGEPAMQGISFYKTAELAEYFRDKVYNKPDFRVGQLTQVEMFVLLAESRFQKAPGIEFHIDEQTVKRMHIVHTGENS